MFIHRIKINFFDCDPEGILFYARIYQICHSAYESMISSFSLKEDYWNNEEYAVPISSSEAKFMKPIKYGEIIIIELTVTQLHTFSFELGYLCKNENGESCAKVKTVHVNVDKKTWKKKDIGKEVRAGLEKYIYINP
jgi:YbgC/YbaW family acyl-CoA thioester hydrolase